jgi:(p)ppGpp synthase/HD superfamily hydrolase
MELQAIRYASMVSTMTFHRAVDIHAQFLSALGEKAEEAQQRLLEFLGWEEPDEEHFAVDVRIVLVSEDFGKELTTAVLWLREHDIDISCVRLRPYQNGTSRLIDVQQIIPLPEANAAMVSAMTKLETALKPAIDSLKL